MQKEKKELLKNFKKVIEDLLDNYDSYTVEEQAQIKEVFQKVVALNKTLDKYDVIEDSAWAEYISAFNQFFPPMGL